MLHIDLQMHTNTQKCTQIANVSDPSYAVFQTYKEKKKGNGF